MSPPADAPPAAAAPLPDDLPPDEVTPVSKKPAATRKKKAAAPPEAPAKAAKAAKTTKASAPKAQASKATATGGVKKPRKKRPDGPKLGMLDLVAIISDECDVTSKLARSMLNSMINVIVTTVAGGRKVVIPGFGTWLRRNKPARAGVNPKNGEPIHIDEHGSVGFKAGVGFRNKVKPPVTAAPPPRVRGHGVRLG